MECELKRGEEGGGGTEGLTTLLEEEVKAATDLLLLTNFSDCLETCRHVIAAIKACEDCDANTADKLGKVQEAATVIGIQALAEQGTWREVIPFVEHVYTHMAACPAPIMQMCLLLHSHVREYMVCHSLIDGWLEFDDHRHDPDSGAIVSTYVSNVLVPLGALNLIPQIVERCSVLSSEERQSLLSPRTPSSPRGDLHRLCASSCPSETLHGTASSLTSSDLPACERKGDDNRPKGLRIVSLYLSLTRKLWRALAKKGWCRQIRRVSKLFFLISFVLLALVHVQTDVTAHFDRAMEMWRAALGAVYAAWRRRPHAAS